MEGSRATTSLSWQLHVVFVAREYTVSETETRLYQYLIEDVPHHSFLFTHYYQRAIRNVLLLLAEHRLACLLERLQV